MEQPIMIRTINDYLAVIEVTGDDASKFLQGQLTNDVNLLNETNSQLSAHLNNKGRIIANFIIFSNQANQYYLALPKGLEEALIKRLKMFVLRSKVTIALSNQTITLCDKPEQIKPSYNFGDNYLVLTEALDESSITENDWHNLLVNANLPFIYPNSSEKIIPQQINFELMGGVNFKKGCYTGQEIVARTHYLGKVKRRLVKFTSKNKPEIGEIITSPLIDNQEIGFVIDFYQNNDNLYTGLASIQLTYIEETHINSQAIKCTNIIENEQPN